MVPGRSSYLGAMAAVLALAACGSRDAAEGTPQSYDKPGTSSVIDRGGAEPIEGESELLTLPHGDTLTVPLGYRFISGQGTDSLVGNLLDATGSIVFMYDGCGLAGERIGAEAGDHGHSVNADFFYGRYPESWPGLLVTFPIRGPSNFFFQESLSDQDALALASTLTALPPESDDLLTLCRFTPRQR